MIISVDGAIGSGKTTLVSLLAHHFGGTEIKHSPPDRDEEPNDINTFVHKVYNSRNDLKELTEQYDKKGNVSKIFLLHNLVRQMLIDGMETDGLVFVDSFWDPFWHFESKYYDKFYPLIYTCLPLPDVSLFLGVSARRSIQRASMRDPNTNYDADAALTQKKMDAWTKWADANVSDFHVLNARYTIDEVLKQAVSIIEKETNG